MSLNKIRGVKILFQLLFISTNSFVIVSITISESVLFGVILPNKLYYTDKTLFEVNNYFEVKKVNRLKYTSL